MNRKWEFSEHEAPGVRIAFGAGDDFLVYLAPYCFSWISHSAGVYYSPTPYLTPPSALSHEEKGSRSRTPTERR